MITIESCSAQGVVKTEETELSVVAMMIADTALENGGWSGSPHTYNIHSRSRRRAHYMAHLNEVCHILTNFINRKDRRLENPDAGRLFGSIST